MRKLRRFGPVGFGLFTVIVAVTLVAVASALGSPAQQQKTSVAMTAGKPSEFRFTPTAKTVLKGAGPLIVAFNVTNRGTVAHDFKIAGKKTLLIAPGKTRVLTVTFSRTGRFPFICTVPSHALAGMKGTLTVKRPA